MVPRADWFESVVIVPDVFGEVDIDGGAVFLCDGCNDDGGAVEILEVHAPGVFVFGVFEP